MRTTVRLPDDLMIAARTKARKEGSTLTQVIEDGVRDFVSKPPPKGGREWVMPPMAVFSGECLIDIHDKEAMEDLEIEEYREKLR